MLAAEQDEAVTLSRSLFSFSETANYGIFVHCEMELVFQGYMLARQLVLKALMSCFCFVIKTQYF